MKMSRHALFTMTILLASGTASAVVPLPTVTGTVTASNLSGNRGRVSVNGHTYTASPQMQSTPASAPVKPGQNVMLLLSPDGKSVISVTPTAPAPAHP